VKFRFPLQPGPYSTADGRFQPPLQCRILEKLQVIPAAPVGAKPLAFVRDELFLNEGVCILRSAYRFGICRELSVAIFTHAKHRNVLFSLDDPKLAFHHGSSSLRAGLIKSRFFVASF
jgi:hypothetical protein